MPCTDVETAFEDIPVSSFWDSTSCMDADWDNAIHMRTQRQLAEASLRSLPEEIASCHDDTKKDLQLSLKSVVEILPLASLKADIVDCEKLAWGRPCQTPETCSPGSIACPIEFEDFDCTPQVEGVDDPKDITKENQMPKCSSNTPQKFAPPPRRASSRRPLHERAITMAPMLRAQHMDILDAQYLNDPDVGKAANQKKRWPSCGGRIQNSKCHHAPPVESPQGNLAPKISPSNCVRNASQTHRRLGPNAIMPVVKGRLQVQAETMRNDNMKEARDAKLRDQFRSKLSAVARPKNQARNTTPRSNSSKRSSH